MLSSLFLAMLLSPTLTVAAPVPTCAGEYVALEKKTKKETKRAIKEVKKTLGFKPRYKLAKYGVTMLEAESSRTVGSLEFYFPKPGVLAIDDLAVKEEYRRKGVSEALFAKVLREHPEIEEIRSDALVQTNEKAIQKELKRGGSCRDAIKATPAYRMRARFGFTELVSFECEDGSFTVRKKQKGTP